MMAIPICQRKENDMARCGKINNKCLDCTERKKNDSGRFYCPHTKCVFTDGDLKFYREVGGATLIDPLEGDQ